MLQINNIKKRRFLPPRKTARFDCQKMAFKTAKSAKKATPKTRVRRYRPISHFLSPFCGERARQASASHRTPSKGAIKGTVSHPVSTFWVVNGVKIRPFARAKTRVAKCQKSGPIFLGNTQQTTKKSSYIYYARARDLVTANCKNSEKATRPFRNF